MNVSACLVTRGDHDMTPITDSLTASGIDDIVVWDNAEREDLAVYGRYAAIEETKHPYVYVQDDDCLLSEADIHRICLRQHPEKLVANMPPEFRSPFYSDHCLVGFGAVFHRDLPERAFDRLTKIVPTLGLSNYVWWLPGYRGNDHFLRTCDVAFTALTPRVLVDVPYENLPWAEDESRMYRQNGHVEERTRMLELVRQVRGA